MRPTYHHVVLSFDGLVHRWCFETRWRDSTAEVILWCTERYGEASSSRGRGEPRFYPVAPIGRWAVYDWIMFSFRDETDAFEFKIRWG
ncbi:MAG: hypothetical protein EOO77_39610 [Oxalobacteraceae bacterium]|nr:MAG: hypothetical protein EOO77_39610 [Oxalobacteraceae bacterium]